MAGKGITRRWIVNGLGVIVAVLVIFAIVFVVAVRFYSYNSVESALYTRANAQKQLVEQSVRTAAPDYFISKAQELAEGFTDKEKMELQVLDARGKILVSTLGFTPEEGVPAPPDFKAATSGKQERGVWRGRSPAGEQVMALTVPVQDGEGRTVGALRYVVSLTLVNQQIVMLIILMFILGAVIIFFIMLSSSYFVSSIVTPVSEIGRAARRIALGDYAYRIDKQYDDEIGELCDTINYMAGEISTAEHMKNDFISSVSHELRTPLTAIKGWSETLRDGGREDAQMMEKGLSVIAGEAERLSGIVEELLDFSRMQSGHISMKLTPLDVLAELEEAVFFFRDRAKREGVEMEYVETVGLPPVMGDRDRIRQVFSNILDNALKYSNAGGRVRVEAADMGDNIQIVISDSGVGIAKEDLPNIKHKFYKANSARPGSGIGLALADEIVRRHKGFVDIDSEEGVGTTVTITLPAGGE